MLASSVVGGYLDMDEEMAGVFKTETGFATCSSSQSPCIESNLQARSKTSVHRSGLESNSTPSILESGTLPERSLPGRRVMVMRTNGENLKSRCHIYRRCI